MKILFSTIRSPFTSEFTSLLEQIRLQAKTDEIGLVLLQDAVQAAYPAPKNPLTRDDVENIVVYAAKEDLKARGLSKGKLYKKLHIVDAGEIVDLVMEKYDKLVSWS